MNGSETAETKPAIVPVSERRFHCDGGGGVHGHPRVFLVMAGNQSSLDCPYCGRRHVLKTESKKPKTG